MNIEQAIDIFGKDVVYEVANLVSMADADGAYVAYENLCMYEHAECVAYLYFENA